jgi:hypothetical protein
MVGWWDASLTATSRLADWQTGRLADWQTGRLAGRAIHIVFLFRPRLNALAPPTNHCPEPSRNHPWSSPAKSHGAKSVDMRETQCRLSDLSRAWAGAATPVHHYHRHLYPTDLRLGQRSGNDHIWRAPFQGAPPECVPRKNIRCPRFWRRLIPARHCASCGM